MMLRKTLMFTLIIVFGCNTVNSEKIKASEQLQINKRSQKTNGAEFRIKNIIINLPEGWSKKEIDTSTIAFVDNCSDTIKFCSNLVVRFLDKDINHDLEAVAEIFGSSLEQQYEKAGVMAINEHHIKKHAFTIVDYQMLEKKTYLGGTTAFFRTNKEIIAFHYTGLNEPSGTYAKDRRHFFDILNKMSIN